MRLVCHCADLSIRVALSPVFPIRAKKCKIFSGIFAQIFHKCKTAFNSNVFHFEKQKLRNSIEIQHFVFCEDAMSGKE